MSSVRRKHLREQHLGNYPCNACSGTQVTAVIRETRDGRQTGVLREGRKRKGVVGKDKLRLVLDTHVAYVSPVTKQGYRCTVLELHMKRLLLQVNLI